jgi:flotillin
LSKVDRITVISTGGDAAGTNKITGDMAKIAAQVPALFEALSGMDLRELMSNISSMRPRGNGNGAAATGPIVEGK